MKSLNKKDLLEYKKQLVNLRKELSSQTKKDLKDGMESVRDDLKDIDDFAQNENDIDIWAIGNNQKHEVLIKIENALTKIENKTYGFCELCNQKINDARLKTIPYTELCINCKEKEEQSKDESATLYPPLEDLKENNDEEEPSEETLE
ncbi:TraR/DksA C4-type zinc finger protein [Candidatus Desantisbacteria bacterium]|nr:TraR/DksA C4-type zinc finger protein [Candidatus Desantisbacteria bacterium]